MSIIDFAKGMTLENSSQQTDDGRFAYSGHQAFGKADNCNSSKHENQTLFTAIQATGSKHRDANAMKRLIMEYTHAATKMQCG